MSLIGVGLKAEMTRMERGTRGEGEGLNESIKS